MLYLLLIAFFMLPFSFSEEVEEVIVTGTILKNSENNDPTLKVLTNSAFNELNIISFAELSKFLTSSSGSRFQTNTLDGVDQGMSNINLRGLDNTSTLLLINSKRTTNAGTPSTRGQGYVDTNLIPEIAIQQIQILKESASPQYGSDAVAGVINVLTYKEFTGLRIKADYQTTTNYDQDDARLGMLYGANNKNSNFVVGFNILSKTPLSASEIPGIAELAISGLGRSFKVSDADTVSDGVWKGVYSKNQKIPDPNCIVNGGELTNPTTCGFLYGERFNIVNDEDHLKMYSNYIHNFDNFQYVITFISSNVDVNDNPQSPSYPALPFLRRKIQPNEGGSPFNVPVTWYGRPLGSEYASPFSPKDIKQFNVNQRIIFNVNESTNLEFSITQSKHSNKHFRPDIIDSRFLEAIKGTGGPNGNETWNLFDSNQNSLELINYVKGAEISKREAKLNVIELILNLDREKVNYAFGLSSYKESLDIYYEETSRASFNDDGQLTKTADLFFLGGGKNVNSSRRNNSFFFELASNISKNLNIQTSARYEKFQNDNSFDPKISFNYSLNNNLSLRGSISSSFVMPSMAQMFSSEINLGSVRDIDSSPFVRQARIGNKDLKPATADSYNIGFIFDKNILKFSLSVWSIDFKDRIELESAQALLNQDSFGSRITRNSEGDLIGVTTTYFNEEKTEIYGFDLNFTRSWEIDQIGLLSFIIDASSIENFSTPDALNKSMVNRVGRFNYDDHTFSLPKNRINSVIKLDYKNYELNINARYINSYINSRPLSGLALDNGYKNKIDSFFVLDFSVLKNIKLNQGDLDVRLAILNLLDKSAPRLYDAPDFSFDTRVHDPRGRIIGVSLEYNF